jgi:predicted transcriptional regulator of viral defense system
MSVRRQTPFSLAAFLSERPVFRLEDLQGARGHATSRQSRSLLAHHLATGRVQGVERGLFVAVPAGVAAERFAPDPFLVAIASRPDAVFCYHAALELHGVAHSDWSRVTVFTSSPRPPLSLGHATVEFLPHPLPLQRRGLTLLGNDTLPYGRTSLLVTGPERTLVDGLRQPGRVGGLGELLDSVGSWTTLDFDLLAEVLEAYDQHNLWAALGWLAEREAPRWRTPSGFLDRCRDHRPRGLQYLVRDARGGARVPAWRLILPPGVTPDRDADAAH